MGYIFLLIALFLSAAGCGSAPHAADGESSAQTKIEAETEYLTEEESRHVADVDFSELTYAAIGDSITYGFCGDHSLPPFTNNYPSCVKTMLGISEVINLGSCGCLLARHSNPEYTSMIDKVDLVPKDTSVISVFGGINDFACIVPMGDINSTDEYTIYGALNTIASKLKTNFANSLVFFVTPLPIGQANLAEISNNDYTIREVCVAIKNVGEKWNIPVYDANLYANFNPNSDSFDGCHPTENYYANVFAPKMVAFIKQCFGIESMPNAEESTREIDFSGLTYVAFGDSITYGADWSKNSANDGSQMEDPYPKLVSEALGLVSHQNYGVGSSTFCSSDRPNLTCATDIILSYDGDADIISVMLGVNDWGYSLPLGTINDSDSSTVYGSLNLIAKHLTANHSDAFVFFITPYKTAISINTDYPLSDIIKAIKEVAGNYNIPVLDMFTEGQFELEMYSEYSDGIHPSQEFVREYTAPMIAEFIKQNYK